MTRTIKLTEEQYSALRESIQDGIFLEPNDTFPQNMCDTQVTADGIVDDGEKKQPAKPKLPRRTALAAQPNRLFRNRF